MSLYEFLGFFSMDTAVQIFDVDSKSPVFAGKIESIPYSISSSYYVSNFFRHGMICASLEDDGYMLITASLNKPVQK